MEAAVKLEPVWSQTVLDEMKTEQDVINFPNIKDEFLDTDIQSLQHNKFQNDADTRELSPLSDERNEEFKTKMDVVEHSVLEDSSELHLCVEMDAAVKLEPVWSQTEDNADTRELAAVSDERNEEVKTEMDIVEHSILEDSLESISIFKGSSNAVTLERRDINIKIDNPHHRGTNPPTGTGSLKCYLCEKCFTRSDSLSSHIRTHIGDKPFKCEVCSKCFTISSNLAKHMRTHTGDKPFKCEVCSKCFAQRTCLTGHIRTHTGDKPFKCEVCSRCFTLRCNLAAHMRTHDDKPFKCEVCNKHFINRNNLAKHIMTHN